MNEGNAYDVAVIGSGLGGLLTASLLAREGLRVIVLEKHSQAGGCLQTFRRKGVVFDTGLHYFGGYDEGGPLRRYWNYFGIPQKLKAGRLDPEGFDIIGFPDAEYPIAMGSDRFVERLRPFFPGEKESLQRYVTTLEEIVGTFPLYNLELPDNHAEEKYRHLSAAGFFASFNPDPTSRVPHPVSEILAGNNLLYGGNPATTPLNIAAAINHSFISGAWRCTGGSGQLTGILLDGFREAGCELFLNCTISSILNHGGRFILKTKDQQVFEAHKIVAAIHPSALLDMIDPSLFRPVYRQRIRSLKNTVASFAIHAVLSKGVFPYRNSNYYGHVRGFTWSGEADGDWPGSFLLQTPSPAAVDGTAESAVILAPMPYSLTEHWAATTTGRRGDDYAGFKQEMADRLLQAVGQRFPELRPAIRYMEVSTPLTWRDYTGVPEGSMYGIEHDYHDPLLTSIMPKTKIPGLWFTGQNVNLHGMLGVTIGAVMTCGEIVGLPYLLNKIRRHA